MLRNKMETVAYN